MMQWRLIRVSLCEQQKLSNDQWNEWWKYNDGYQVNRRQVSALEKGFSSYEVFTLVGIGIMHYYASASLRIKLAPPRPSSRVVRFFRKMNDLKHELTLDHFKFRPSFLVSSAVRTTNSVAGSSKMEKYIVIFFMPPILPKFRIYSPGSAIDNGVCLRS